MNILITGATGFLGSHLVGRLMSEDLTLLATSEHGSKEDSVTALPLSDEELLYDTLKDFRPDIIFHIGALVNLSREYAIAKQCLEVNTVGTLKLLEAARSANVKRFIFASTEEVYGNGPVPYVEDQQLRPPSPYAVSKVAAEEFVQHYFGGSQGSYIVRIGTMYGPKQPEHRFIPELIASAKANIPLNIPNGANRRDYVYVSDVVEAFMKALVSSSGNSCQVINIGSGVSHSLFDLTTIIKEETGSSSKIIDGGLSERAGEASNWLMDISKAKALLDWEPKTTLKEGIIKMIQNL